MPCSRSTDSRCAHEPSAFEAPVVAVAGVSARAPSEGLSRRSTPNGRRRPGARRRDGSERCPVSHECVPCCARLSINCRNRHEEDRRIYDGPNAIIPGCRVCGRDRNTDGSDRVALSTPEKPPPAVHPLEDFDRRAATLGARHVHELGSVRQKGFPGFGKSDLPGRRKPGRSSDTRGGVERDRPASIGTPAPRACEGAPGMPAAWMCRASHA